MGNESIKFRDGDVIYIPEKMNHSITNEGDDMVEFWPLVVFHMVFHMGNILFQVWTRQKMYL